MSIAVHALTKNGVEIARKLYRAMPSVQLFISEQLQAEGAEIPFSLPLSTHLDKEFSRYSHHVCIFSVGIAARLIAPKLVDKRSDPAVVCIDEQGLHVVAFAGGHRGGANELCQQVAKHLSANPVITTASDSSQTLSVDMMGHALNWCLDQLHERYITPVSAAIVNQEPVVICQLSGEQTWWPYPQKLPSHIEVVNDRQQLLASPAKSGVLISDMTDVSRQSMKSSDFSLVVWRPRSLFIGIGCDRNTPVSVIKQGLTQFMADHQLAVDSIAELVSIELKADELGIIDTATELQRPFNTFSAQVLENVEGIENPSMTVKRCVGVTSVAEAACLYASGQSRLLVAKHKYHFDGYNMTLAACRKSYAKADCVVHQSMLAKADKPIRSYRYHLVVCEGGRCGISAKVGLAHNLRALVKQQGLASGSSRVKVTRSHCLGCCRKRVPMVIYQGTGHKCISVNHGVWLQHVHKLTDQQWITVLQALATDTAIAALLPSEFISTITNSPVELTV